MKGLQLKRLEAYGFKSFADKIEIEFDHGVTAVVGPNGSGKSNITDAIRWVLGEQNVRNLRGAKAEDIIFTGSVARRALGVAEVSLTLINQGDLPVDFDEVVITRRLFRSGDSEFSINKTRCRLKDIHSLLAGTGLGHDGLSVISQNKIDEILNSRPEERRLFFEETAGITKYRDQKREALRKLKDMEENLVRAGDILHEIETELEPLAVEAERTRRHNAWRDDLRLCKVTELYRAQEELRAQEDEERERFDAQRAAEVAATAEAGRFEAEKARLEQEALDLERTLQEKADEKNAVKAKIDEKNSDIRVLEDRYRRSDEKQKELAGQREALAAEKAEAEKALKELREQEEAVLAEQKTAEEKAEEAKTNASEIAAEEKNRRQAVENLSTRQAEENQKYLAKANELELLKHDIESGRAQSEQQEKDAEALEKKRDEERERLGALSERAETLAANQQRLVGEQKDCETKQRELAKVRYERQQTLRSAQQFVDNAEAKRETLLQLQKEYAGFGNAPKVVLTAKESWRRGVCGAVAELIEVPAKYLAAAEAALGGAQQDIVTEDADTAKAAIEYLKKRRAGRATFLPLSTLTLRGGRDEEARRMAGVLGYMNEVVGIKEKYKAVVDFLLARTLLVDTVDHALAVAKRQGYRARIVTLGGELLNPGGSISGGSLQGKESGFLNRGEEIEALGRQIEARKAEAADAQKECDDAEQQTKEAAKRLEEIVEELQKVRVEAAETATRREELEKQEKADAVRLDALRSLTRSAAKTFAEAQKQQVEIARELRAIKGTLATLSREKTRAGDTLRELEQDLEDAAKLRDKRMKEADNLRIKAVKCRGDVRLKEKDVERIQKDEEKNRAEAESLLAGLSEGTEKVAGLRVEAQELSEVFDEMERAYQEVYRERLQRLSDSRDAETGAGKAQQKLKRIQDQLHQMELEAEKVRLRREQCLETLREEYRMGVPEAAAVALDIAAGELSARVRTLEESLAELGPVNPAAIEEHRKKAERHDFYKAQIADIESGKANLLQVIEKIDATMTKQFRAAFADIRTAFHEIFVKLFGGGTANLFLTDEKNVLESGVEIVVQIPDKKQQNLSALSGGERALTVIALLFSFLRVRPAPFSVLDEIDAPLDEANIARFGRFLREFSEKTQFVIVTHRKGTMEAADTMYGVTLEDAGVSKIISVRLDDIDE